MEPLTTAVSVDYKINLGNYESAAVFLSISNITTETTPNEIDEILDQSKIAYTKIIDRVRRKAITLREEL